MKTKLTYSQMKKLHIDTSKYDINDIVEMIVEEQEALLKQPLYNVEDILYISNNKSQNRGETK